MTALTAAVPRLGRLLTPALCGLAVLLVMRTEVLLPRTTPLGIVFLGIVIGGINALLAIGIVLVYRTNRVINFAHGELGAFAGVLAAQLMANGWSYLIAVAVSIVVAAILAVVIEVTVVRRFADSPRLILTVATIGLSLLLIGFELLVPRLFDRQVLSTQFETPLSNWSFEIAPVIFDGNHLLIVAFTLVAAAGLGMFLRSHFGIAVRATAENLDRAALCGIPTKLVSTAVWAIAGSLSAAAAILQGPVVGLQVGVMAGPGLLLRALAAAVLGKMTSLPVAVAAALGLGVLEQSIFWSYGRSTVIDAALLGVILVGLMLQRRTLARVDPADATSWQAVTEVRPVPRELRDLPIVRLGRAGVIGALVALAVGVPTLFGTSRQTLAAVVIVFAMVGISLVVLTGWGGQISLGQFGLVGIGGAVAGSLTADAGTDFLVGVVGGGVGGMVAAVVLGLPALRVRGFFLAVTTLAFAVTTSSFLLRLEWLVPTNPVARPMLLGRFDLENELTYYYVCLASLVLVILGVNGLRRSRVGRAIVAVRDNERSAQAFGISPIRAKLTCFGAAGFVAGVAGALLVHQQHGLPPTQYAPQQSLSVFVLAVIGGLGSVPGAILGAVYVKGSQYLLQGPYALLASGVGVLFLLLALPKGLGSVVIRARDWALTRVAAREGIEVPSLVADRRTEVEPPIVRVEPAPVDGVLAEVSR